MNNQRKMNIGELRKQAINYYKFNQDISKKIEDALNSVFYDAPYDVYGYLSEYFGAFAKPAFITRISACKRTYFDAKCQPVIRLNLFCRERNTEKQIVSVDLTYNAIDAINDSCKIQIIQEEDAFRASKINDVVSFINNNVNDLLRNFSPTEQDELDQKLNKLFEDKHLEAVNAFNDRIKPQKENNTDLLAMAIAINEEDKKSKTPSASKKAQQKLSNRKNSTSGLNPATSDDVQAHLNSTFYASFILSHLSKTLCVSAALLTKKQLFEHVGILSANIFEKFFLPLPLVTVLQNGKGFYGKQTLVKEFILMPKASRNICQTIDSISKVNQFIRDTLYQSKQLPGAVNKCVTEQGSLTCALESPQQGLEMIENAIKTVCSPEMANNLQIALNVAGNELFDVDKNKYEIASATLKSSDELVEVYLDLLTKNERIKMLIEPFASNDQLSWYKLNARVGKQCLIVSYSDVNDFAELKAAESEEKKEKISLEVPSLKSSQDSSLSGLQKLNIKLKTPVNLYKFENTATVSSLIENVNTNRQERLLSGLSCSNNESDDSFLTDLSVGCRVNFLKVGGFNRQERVKKLNRLIEIEDYLNQNGLLEHISEEDEVVEEFIVPEQYADLVKAYIQSLDDTKGKKK